MRKVLLGCVLALLASCGAVPAWQRGALADRRMQWMAERHSGRLHVFAVREGGLAGGGGGGAGCGCD